MSEVNGNGSNRIVWFMLTSVVGVVGAFALFTAQGARSEMTQMHSDIEAARRECRVEIDAIKALRAGDLPRLTAVETKLDAIKESIERTERKIDDLSKARRR